MTTGSLWKNILLFSLPLMMTQVLEVLFNLGTLTWTVFQGKDFTWNQWNSQNLNWMEFEIFS